MDETTAQVSQPQMAEPAAQPEYNQPAVPMQPAPQEQHQGFQARINELTARAKAAEAQAAEYQSNLQRQTMEFAAQMASFQRPTPEPIDPLKQYEAAVDPNVLQAMKAALATQQATFQRQLDQQTRQLAAQQSALEVQALASRSPGIDPAIAQRAAQLVQQARMQGSNASATEALNFAVGEWYLKNQARAAPVANFAPQAFNVPNPTLNLPPPPVRSRPVSRQEPANFDRMSIEQQLAWYEQQGIGDDPI